MTSNSVVSGRAARRTAARKPAPVVAPQVLEPDEPFGDADFDDEPTVAASTAPEKATPVLHRVSDTSLAVDHTSTRHGAIQLPMEGQDLSRQIDAGDVILPKLRISQAMSAVNTEYMRSKGKSGVVAGEWYISTSSRSLGEEVFFIPTDMQKSRGYFEAGAGLKCRSYDLVQGVGTPGVLCEGTLEERATLPKEQRGCPLRLWKHGNKPECGVSYNFTGLLIENIDDPKSKVYTVLLSLRGASGTAGAKQLNTLVGNEVGGVWHNAIVRLSSEETTNTKGTFRTVTAEFYDDATDPDFERFHRRAQRLAQSRNPNAVMNSLEADAD